jgi:hypothetical protein
MHNVKRASATISVATALMLGSVTPALADGWYGNVECGQQPNPGCELGAGRNGDGPAPPQPGHDHPNPGKEGAPGGHNPRPNPGDSLVGGDSNLARCSYVRSDYQPPAPQVQTVAFRPHRSITSYIELISAVSHRPSSVALAQAPSQSGAWYIYQCSGPGIRDGLYRAPVWMPDGQAPGAAAPLPSPEEMAQRARSQLRLPSPKIASNPAGTQLVTLPTWLWLDRGSWGAQSATASVPGVSVTAVATPTSASWSMGDGTDLTCAGPGTPFPTGGDPAASSPDCGHTYHRSSASAPGQQFPATATVQWTVAWSGAGASGTFPDMTTSATAAFRVAEAQALGTGRR